MSTTTTVSTAFLSGEQMARWIGAGTTAVYAYDTLITLDMEVSNRRDFIQTRNREPAVLIDQPGLV
jgi:hypothetical protein